MNLMNNCWLIYQWFIWCFKLFDIDVACILVLVRGINKKCFYFFHFFPRFDLVFVSFDLQYSIWTKNTKKKLTKWIYAAKRCLGHSRAITTRKESINRTWTSSNAVQGTFFHYCTPHLFVWLIWPQCAVYRLTKLHITSTIYKEGGVEDLIFETSL